VRPSSPCYLTISGHYSTGWSWSRRAWPRTLKVPSSPSSKSGKTPRSSSASLVDHPPRAQLGTYTPAHNEHSLTHSLTHSLAYATPVGLGQAHDYTLQASIILLHRPPWCLCTRKREALLALYLLEVPCTVVFPTHLQLRSCPSALAIFSAPRSASDFFPFPAHREPESQKNLFVAPRRCPRLEGPWFQSLLDPRLRAVASSFAYSF
jgi:hypothetical protein